MAEDCSVAPLTPAQMRDAHALHTEYIDETSYDAWQRNFEAHPHLHVGCTIAGRLIGIACGHTSPRTEGAVVLDAIAVVVEHWRSGFGSRLLSAFEEQVQASGRRMVTLGSAGGYVDDFYRANGYECVAYLIGSPENQPDLEDLRHKYADVIEPGEDPRRLAIDVRAMEDAARQQVCADFAQCHINPIMDKMLVEEEESES